MPANIVNAGTPLTPSAAAPLWTDLCDTSSNMVNTAAPADIVVPLNGASGPGTIELPTWIQALDQIESVVVGGTIKGKRGDTVSLNLKHETLGAIPLLTNHGIQGALTTAYPLPGEMRTFSFGETIPPGYIFKNFVGTSSALQVTLPEGQAPDFYYASIYNVAVYDWQIKSTTPGGSLSYITVPAHRYPYSPTYNFSNQPAPPGMLNATEPIVFRGFRYRAISGSGDPILVSTRTFTHPVADENDPDYTNYNLEPDDWSGFVNQYGFSGYSQSTSAPFSEPLWENYGAHDWTVVSVVRHIDHYNGGTTTTPVTYTRTYDVVTVRFTKYADVTWSVEPLAQVTWETVVPPSAVYQFYPPDYGDFQAMAERSESLNLTSLDWKGKPADGIWTLEFGATSAPIAASLPSTQYGPAAFSPTVNPAIVRIDGLTLTIKFKGNPQYQTAVITPTTPSPGVIQAVTQGNLRSGGDDRSLIAVLCGVNGSTTMGILCGYSLLRVGRTGEIYDVSYFLATTCNVNHVNLTRLIKSISYFGKDWGDRPFSTKGDAGEAFVLGPVQHRIYPVRGQIGLQVKIIGNRLTFMMLGQYPPLVYQDPTVLNVNTFTKLSLNA